ncbi:MAG: methionine ABC transporter ATP-binding protein [Clostridium sp.]|nr:methionine ABC transporter ATP-binding protein [Clostridium sp.]
MIEVLNLEKNYGELKVLKDVSFKIEEGKIYGIIGHSGAGKSTMLRCINGLEKYNTGKLMVMGRNVCELAENELRIFRKDVGMIFQHFNLMERATVKENVALPLKLWKYEKSYIDKKVDELLSLVGLENKKNAKPKELSGGEKQRVAIARALALEPKILLCDEATSALDPKTTKDILALISHINRKLGITIVVVTHQMEVVKEICERVVLLDKGEVKEEGVVEDLFLRPGQYLKKFLGEDEEIILGDGVNIKIYFPASVSKEAFITNMAHDLKIDFSIVWGKLEKFREKILGSLVIQVQPHEQEAVERYLQDKSFKWEVI